jgi:hypothetical protein
VKRKLSTREFVMIGLLAVASVMAFRMMTGDGIGFGGGAEKEAEAREFGEAPVVRMDLLARERARFDREGRNLFDYYTPPPPPRKKVQRKAPTIRDKPKPIPKQAPAPPPKPTAPKPPAPKFNYLGYLGPKDAKIAVFDDGKPDGVMLARIGDVVQDDFRVMEFKHDSVTMAYTKEKWEGHTTELKLLGLR